MTPISLNPPATFAIADGAMTIGVVGCGGTGSHLLDLLARVLVDRTAVAERVTLLAIDGDTVEPAQPLSATVQCARPGCQQSAGARRPAERGLRAENAGSSPHGDRRNPAPARPALWSARSAHRLRRHGARASRVGRRVGTEWVATVDRLWQRRICRSGGAWHHDQEARSHRVPAPAWAATALPALPLVFPDVLTDAQPQPVLDCAGAVATGRQSMFINAAVAQIAASYVSDFCLSGASPRFGPTSISARAVCARTQSRHARSRERPVFVNGPCVRGRSHRGLTAKENTYDGRPSGFVRAGRR